jgi:hypothetical protein
VAATLGCGLLPSTDRGEPAASDGAGSVRTGGDREHTASAPAALDAPGGSPPARSVADVSALPTHRELTWTFADGPFGALDVLVSVPERPAGDDRRFPVLVAFHGRGESRKGRRAGARAWVKAGSIAR